jgi:hypothetical protein
MALHKRVVALVVGTLAAAAVVVSVVGPKRWRDKCKALVKTSLQKVVGRRKD